MSQGQQERFLFESDTMESNAFHVVRFAGTEGLNKLYRFEITLASALDNVDLDALLQGSARLILIRNGKYTTFSGLLSSVTQDTHYNGYTFYTVVLQPRFWKLTQLVQNHIYLDKNLQDTVKEALNFDEAFRVDARFNLLGADYPQHEFSLQYNESVYDYCTNKLETEGVYYFFEQNAGGDRECVVFTDSHMGHAPLVETPSLMYSPVTGMEASHAEEVITSFSLRKSPLPKTVVLRAYNWQTPNTPVVAEASVSPTGLGEVYYSDNDFTSSGEGQRLAKIRAEELRCQGTVFSGVSAVPTLRPGFVFALERHYQASFNREYMITEVTHEGSQEGFLSSVLGIKMEHGNDYYYYRNNFNAIRSNEQFRPARVTPRVKMQGVVTAFIDGAGKANKPELDTHGRYKVIFAFDMSGRKEGKASCWLRMSQPHVGVGYGTSFPLTPGIEVTVTFVDGNPDRPLITGALTNTESGPLVNNVSSSTAGISSASGNSLVFNEEDTKQGVVLSTASGRSGLIMGSGSTDYMQVSSDYNVFASNLLSTSLGGVATSAWTAFRTQEVIGMGAAYTALMTAMKTLSSISSAFTAQSAVVEAEAAKTGQSGGWDAVGWKTGAALAKNISQALPLALGAIIIKKEPMYSYQLMANKSTVKRVMLQAPSTPEFIGFTLAGFLGAAVPYAVAQGGEFLEVEAEKEKSEKAATDKRNKYICTMGDLITKYDGHGNMNEELYLTPTPPPSARVDAAVRMVCTIANTGNAIQYIDAESQSVQTYSYAPFIPTLNSTLSAHYNTVVANDLNTFLEAWDYVCGGGYEQDTKKASTKYESAKAQAERSILSSTLSDLLPELITFCLTFLPVYQKLNKKTMGGLFVNTDSNILTHSVKDTFITSNENIFLQVGGDWAKMVKVAGGNEGKVNFADYLKENYSEYVPNIDKEKYIFLDAQNIVHKADNSFEWVTNEKNITSHNKWGVYLRPSYPISKKNLEKEIARMNTRLLSAADNLAEDLLYAGTDIEKIAEVTEQAAKDTLWITERIATLQLELTAVTREGSLILDSSSDKICLDGRVQGPKARICFERSAKSEITPPKAPVQTISLEEEGITLSHKPDDGADVAEIRLTGKDKNARKITLKLGPTANECSVVIEDKKITLTGPENESSIVLDKDGITLKGKTIKVNAGGKTTTFSSSKVDISGVPLSGASKVTLV